MERRDAIKTIAVAAMAVTSLSAYDEKLIINTKDMTIKDVKNPTEGELKHSPDIKVGKADAEGFTVVEVEVGQEGIIHPSVANHWIYQIELFADGKRVGEADLEPVVSRGFLACRVNLKEVKSLSAIARCNLHGNYTTTIDVA